MTKRSFITFISLMFVAVLWSQQKKVAVYSGYGSSYINYSPSIGSLSKGTGMNFGAEFIYFFNEKWGISGGIGYTNYLSSLSINGDSIYQQTVDTENEPFTFKAYFNNYTESQKISEFNIPIKALYQYTLNEKMSIIGGAGLQVGILTSASAQGSDGTITTKGYFPSFGYDFENIPAQGFSTYSMNQPQNLTASTNLSFVADVLFSYKIKPLWELFAGVYYNYGLTNLSTPSNNNMVEYNSNSSPKVSYHNALNSNVTNSANSAAMGLKIGACFDIGGYFEAKRAKEQEAFRRTAQEEADMRNKVNTKQQSDIMKQAEQLAKEMKMRQMADSINKAEILRQQAREKAIADSIAESERLKLLKDSVDNLKKEGEGKVIMEIRTNELNQEELNMLQLPIDFNKGEAIISDKYKNNALKIGEILAKHPNLTISITGHTCDLGSEDSNYKLGLQRAKTLQDAFIQSGTDAQQISISSKGELEPLVPNTDETARKKNRRVVIIIADK